MAYMRGNPYIYSDGENLIIIVDGDEVRLPMPRAEELAAMLWHRLTPDAQQATMARVIEHHDGNLGAEGVQTALGLPTVLERILTGDLVTHPHGHPCRNCDRLAREHPTDTCQVWS